jgi:hypothetical protein
MLHLVCLFLLLRTDWISTSYSHTVIAKYTIFLLIYVARMPGCFKDPSLLVSAVCLHWVIAVLMDGTGRWDNV